MAQEDLSSPEREQTPKPRLFNVDEMSDVQIIVTNRAIGFGAYWNPDEIEADGFEAMTVADELHDYLAEAVRGLATRDPERVKQLAQRCLNSKNQDDLMFAAKFIEGLIEYDYAFTRDSLIWLLVSDEPNYADHDGWVDAKDALERLANERLTPEQIDDFSRAMTAQAPWGSYSLLQPAAPEDA
jgi:hypothetical protein